MLFCFSTAKLKLNLWCNVGMVATLDYRLIGLYPYFAVQQPWRSHGTSTLWIMTASQMITSLHTVPVSICTLVWSDSLGKWLHDHTQYLKFYFILASPPLVGVSATALPRQCSSHGTPTTALLQWHCLHQCYQWQCFKWTMKLTMWKSVCHTWCDSPSVHTNRIENVQRELRACACISQ